MTQPTTTEPDLTEAMEVWREAHEAYLTATGDRAIDPRIAAAHVIATALEARDAELAELRAGIDTPLTDDFVQAVNNEALHQRRRWGADHDAGKSPFDWFWLIGYLAQKAADAAVRGDAPKALHHTVSTAAALANWHLALSGACTAMRPGIDPDAAILTKQEPSHDRT